MYTCLLAKFSSVERAYKNTFLTFCKKNLYTSASTLSVISKSVFCDLYRYISKNYKSCHCLNISTNYTSSFSAHWEFHLPCTHTKQPLSKKAIATTHWLAASTSGMHAAHATCISLSKLVFLFCCWLCVHISCLFLVHAVCIICRCAVI